MVGSIFILDSDRDYIYGYSGLSTVSIGSINMSSFASTLKCLTIDSDGNLWSHNGGGYVYQFSGISNIAIGSGYLKWPIVQDDSNLSSIGYVNSKLYFQDSNNPPLLETGSYITNLPSGTSLKTTGSDIIGSFSIGFKTESMATSGGNLYLLRGIADNNKFVYKLSGASNTLLGSINLTEPSDNTSPDMGIAFGSSGNLLFLSDTDTTSLEQWVIYEYSGFSNSLIGSVVFPSGTDYPGQFVKDFIYVIGAGPLTINNSDSLTITDSLTKYIRVNKTFSDSSSSSDAIFISGIVTTKTLHPSDNITVEDNNIISKYIRVSKTFSDSSHPTDSFSFSQIGVSTPNITFVTLQI